MKTKRILVVFIALIFLAGIFSSCRNASPGSVGDSADLDQNPIVDAGADQEQDSNPEFFTDEEGFVAIRLEGGEASIHFNATKWEEFGDYLGAYNDSEGKKLLEDSDFPVTGLSSKIKDIFVGQIPGMNSHIEIPFNVPSVVMLLEDGSVAYVAAIPPYPEPGAGLEATSLTGLADIVSLSYESTGEGIGDTTVYAIDGEDLRYDVQIPWKLRFLTDGRWICNLDVDDEGMPTVCGYLEFLPGNSIEWYVGWPNSDIAMGYEGTYELILAESQNARPGTIVFDMKLTYVYEGKSNNEPLKGMYFTEAYDYGEICLNLFPADGDYLYTPDIDVYEFILEEAAMG